MPDTPNWFDENEYSDFLAESSILFEFNVPLQKEKIESRKKIREFDRQMTLRRFNLKNQNMRDEAQAKARGIQMGLGEGLIKEKLKTKFLNKLAEEKTPIKAEKRKMRPEVDPQDRERDRKREDRKEEKQSGLSNIIIVKNNKLNKIEIIPKDDFDAKNHTLLKGKVKKLDKGNVTKRDLNYYSSLDNFMNTKTSIKLLGGKVEKKQKEEKKETKPKTQKQPEEETPEPPLPRVPTDGKEITDPKSTYPDWDHTKDQLIGTIPDAISSLTGKQTSKEFEATVSSSRTLGDALQRFNKELMTVFPEMASLKFEKLEPGIKTSKKWAKYGIEQAIPNATLLATGEGEPFGIAVKIGEQYKPTIPGEAGAVLSSIIQSIPAEQIVGSFSPFIDDLLKDLRKMFSTSFVSPNYGASTEATQKLIQIKQQKADIENSQKIFINKASELFENYINENTELKAAFILEALSGNIKFDGKTGSAQMLLSAQKDGTDVRSIPLGMEFATILAKSNDTNLNFKFVREIKKNSFLQSVLDKITPLNESVFDGISELEKIKNEISIPSEFLKIFELKLVEATFQEPILYSDFYQNNTEKTNIVTINPGSKYEQKLEVPVQRVYTPAGDEENIIEKGADALLEEYFFINDYLVEKIQNKEIEYLDAIIKLEEIFELQERNYRKEYDNYHGKPKQRANRSKRVLARRKMENQGKVRKGDGKDVHHKDGNPQNNGDDNLKVLPKSKNRSMNEDHGAGFEGTDQLVQNLIDQTPFAINPLKKKLVAYIEDRYLKKTKKK